MQFRSTISVLLILASLLTIASADYSRRNPTNMVHILKNPDGTVNFDAVKKETDFLKGWVKTAPLFPRQYESRTTYSRPLCLLDSCNRKYAQNAENAKKNAAQQATLEKPSANSHAPRAPFARQGDIVPPKAEGPQ